MLTATKPHHRSRLRGQIRRLLESIDASEAAAREYRWLAAELGTFSTEAEARGTMTVGIVAEERRRLEDLGDEHEESAEINREQVLELCAVLGVSLEEVLGR